MFVGLTVLFSLVSFGSFFSPAACFLVVACRFAHMSREPAPELTSAR